MAKHESEKSAEQVRSELSRLLDHLSEGPSSDLFTVEVGKSFDDLMVKWFEVRPHTDYAQVQAVESGPVHPEITKVTVNLPTGMVDKLKRLAAEQSKTFTQVLKEAISLKLFCDEVLNAGGKLLIENPDKTIERIILR